VAVAARRAAGLLPVGGAVLALALAVVLFAQFSLDDVLKRDEAIYAYGGQQLVEGVAPYASVFDPKTPLGTGFAALGVAAARAAGATDGAGDLHGMRILFFAFACLAVLAVYLLGLWLWGSTLAAFVGATLFAAFRGFALDALGGPNAKTPGVFLAALSMALLVRRRWFTGALVGGLAFLVWQPLGIYAAIAVVAAPLTSEAGRRRDAFGRALAGAALPVVATAIVFWATGALPKLIEAAVRFPLTGIIRPAETVEHRLRRIHAVIYEGYKHTHWLIYLGLATLLVLIAARLVRGRHDLRAALTDPLVLVVGGTLIPLAVFSATDFQGYPDVYPALPYAAVGVGGLAAVVTARVRAPRWRQVVTAAWLVGAVAFFAASWSWFASSGAPPRGGLAAQRANAAVLDRALARGERLYVLGNPMPLVLTRRRNPSRFVYRASGAAQWDVRHTPGGFEGWKRRLLATHPGIVMVAGWRGRCQLAVSNWLGTRFERAYADHWSIFVTPAVRADAARRGVVLPRRPGRPEPTPSRCEEPPDSAR
jgi:hypothetical protein